MEGLGEKTERGSSKVVKRAGRKQSRKKKAHRRLTGLGIASGSILCLDFCTAGMSDACFILKSLSSIFVQKQDNMNKIEGIKK